VATVHATSPHEESVQCGSVPAGNNVSIPIYCDQTYYKTTFVVNGTDDQFTDDLDSAPTIGAQKTVYETGAHQYDTTDPHSGSALALEILISLVLGLILCGVLFFVRMFMVD